MAKTSAALSTKGPVMAHADDGNQTDRTQSASNATSRPRLGGKEKLPITVINMLRDPVRSGALPRDPEFQGPVLERAIRSLEPVVVPQGKHGPHVVINLM